MFFGKRNPVYREVFSSYPDGVLAVRLDAEGREGHFLDCRLGRCHNWTDEMGREGRYDLVYLRLRGRRDILLRCSPCAYQEELVGNHRANVDG